MVSARNLAVVRDGFSLRVEAFDADAAGVALLGPNGAGKTTLLGALAGYFPASGSRTCPHRTAGVFARPAVLRGSTLANTASIVAAACRVPSSEAHRRAVDALESVGLAPLMERDARDLSTGERQRLALARALAVQPQGLFLDEPFANVDVDARPRLRALVRSYADRTGCDLIIATSNLADAFALARSVVVLHAGRVTEELPVERLEESTDGFVRALLAEGAPRQPL